MKGRITGEATNFNPIVAVLGTLNVAPDDDIYHKLTGNRYLTSNEDLREIKPNTFIDLERSANDDLKVVTYKPSRKQPIKREEADYHSRDVSDYILVADNGAIAKNCWHIAKVKAVSNVFFKGGQKFRYSDHEMLVAKLVKSQ